MSQAMVRGSRHHPRTSPDLGGIMGGMVTKTEICPGCGEPAQVEYAVLPVEEESAPIVRQLGIRCFTVGCQNYVAPPRVG